MPQLPETNNKQDDKSSERGSGDSIATHIARNWYREMKLEYSGVDFGKCIVYDCLQIVNRAVVKQKNEREQ